MAEFQEVMRQLTRMCDNNCYKCPLNKLDIHCPVLEDGIESNVEQIVMDWAVQHPEPRYPTWNEWHESNFPEVSSLICPKYFSDDICESNETCTQCRAQSIPADIAQKLGVKLIV